MKKEILKDNKGSRIVKKIASLAPYLGGFLVESFNQKIQDYEKGQADEERKRIYSLMTEIANEIQETNLKIEKGFISKEKFNYLVEKSIKAAREAGNPEKIKMLKNTFLNALESEENFEESLDLINLINTLENIHMLVLKRCWEQLIYARKIGSPEKPNVTLDGLSDFYKKIPRRTLERTSSQLIGTGLLENPRTEKIDISGVYTLTDYGVFFCEKIIELK